MLTMLITGLLVAVTWIYSTWNFDYWTKRGVKHDKPVPLFGTNMKNYLLRIGVVGLITETYKKFPNERLVGFFRGSRPELIISDVELSACILKNDFHFFHRRGVVYISNPPDLLFKQLLTAEDDLWRQLRIRTTPAFSTGKLKAMFPLIVQRSERLQARLDIITADGQALDVKDLLARFTTDIISSVAFGIVSDSLNNDDDAMRQLGNKMIAINFTRILKQTLISLMPKTFSHLKLLADVENEVIDLVQSVMKQRNYEPSGRRDFIDLLLEAKKKGAMTGPSIVLMNADGTPKKVSIEMDDAIMAAQCFVFYAAGFETSASVSSYTLHELAHNVKIQEKVQSEIDSVLARHDNKLSYDAISEMTYLRWCLNEAMRICPPVPVLVRKSVQQYTFPETKVTIDAGVNVYIPLEAYQNDPKIFPEPKEFRPERFDPVVMTARQKLAYLPFGDGPRACIGQRMGLMMSMTGVATVLSQFRVRPAPGTPRYPVISPLSVVVADIEGGLPLILQKRSTFEPRV